MLDNDTLVIDCDSHWCETADFFTSRAPAPLRDRMPHVEQIEGRPTWVFDGHPLGPASAGAVIGRDGHKVSSNKGLFEWTIDMVHVGAWDPKARLQVLDECGISAQVIYPNTIGLGGQSLCVVKDQKLCRTAIEIYNDAMAEIQADSGNRLLPMPVMPAWSVEASIAEARRMAALGARGVNMTQDPPDLGAPDLGDRAWDPFWEVCTELELPVHFHIGASVTTMTFYGSYPWPSHPVNTQLAIGGTLLFVGNARIVVNAILSGMFDRHPDLDVVSVESGIGWIPFILEALDYEMAENAPDELSRLKKPPSEYFRSNMYATFWFERNRNKLRDLVEAVGEDRILFETDFPHPTCLYPNPLQTVEAKMATLSGEVRRKILGENAKQLYRL